MRDRENKFILMKEVVVHCKINAATAKITMTKRYMNMWNVCLLMTIFLVGILVIVCNWPIEFYIKEQRAIWSHRFWTLFQVRYTICINILKLRTDIIAWQKKRQVWIKIYENNRDTFIATLHNVLLSRDRGNIIFSITTLMNLVHTFLFKKCFTRCNLEPKRKIQLPCHIVHKENMHFRGK